MQEIWKDIVGFEGYYQISNFGNLRSLDRYVKCDIKNNDTILIKGKLLKFQITAGYYHLTLSKNHNPAMYRVHRLVALNFIDNPNNYPFVNHINCITTDNRVSNLEWCTHQQNRDHAFINGLMPTPKKSINQYSKNGEFIKNFESIFSAAKELNCDRANLGKVVDHPHKTAYGFIWKTS